MVCPQKTAYFKMLTAFILLRSILKHLSDTKLFENLRSFLSFKRFMAMQVKRLQLIMLLINDVSFKHSCWFFEFFEWENSKSNDVHCVFFSPIYPSAAWTIIVDDTVSEVISNLLWAAHNCFLLLIDGAVCNVPCIESSSSSSSSSCHFVTPVLVNDFG